jgi:peptidoglycan/xylan/chitin deacetylase (PgdA/CDA1 family)
MGVVVGTIKKIIKTSLLAVAVVALAFSASAPAFAAVNNPAPAAKVSFTFDDGAASAITKAAPTLAAHGLTGTAYIATDCIGLTTTPNSCAADGSTAYMSWAQVTQLRDTHGWEIAGHTASHPQLATEELSAAELAAEIGGGKQALIDHGFNPTAFATPYGDYDNNVLAEIAKHYTSHRGFHDLDNNVWSYNDYLLNNMQVQAGVSVQSVKDRIDDAIANNLWLVLTFHDIRDNPSNDEEDYQYATADLNEIAAYVKAKKDANQLKAVNVTSGLVTSDTNLLTNGGFASGFTGWSTNTPDNVALNTANRGSFPDPANSASITASASGNVHLFSPRANVDSNLTYLFKSFLQLTAIAAGELGYYVDEFDNAGNWISGQWIDAAVTAQSTRNVNFPYKPTSAEVKAASLQVYATGGSGIQAFVDSFQLFALNGTDTPPPPAINNLLPNSDFEHGMADGWTTNNPTAFSADTGGNGSPETPTTAIKILAGTANASLFAPQVEVQSLDTYNITAYLNVLTRGSEEVAFYIDEYDLGGNWVSGQYAYAKRSTGIENVSFNYVPTSVNVKKAGLQLIVVGNSGITGFVDNIQFLAPGTPPPDPDPGPDPDPTPTGPNLVPNGTFDGGLAEGWTTNDPTNITADSGNHGGPNNPVNAVKLLSSDINRHLFSPQVTVDPAKSYSLTSYLAIEQITGGEVAFYIDEYDLSGNWISGQYKTGVSVISAGDVSFTYTPTSASVSKASLQIIVVGNSGIQAYIDDIRWLVQE